MKRKLIILSDLWGSQKSEWIEYYIQNLKDGFEIKYYDCCILANIDQSVYTEVVLHQQFVNGGIDKAVQKLLALEKEKISILAFSIGGVIAWKFGNECKYIESLCCVSSTRLRHEVIQPEGKITLYFGEKDHFKPPKEWFDKMNLNAHTLLDQGHLVYRNREFAEQLCKEIL